MRRPSSRRSATLALVLLAAAAAACAPMAAGDGAVVMPAPPAVRFATALEASDPAVDAGIALMDAFERRAAREERAVAFALGRASAALPAAAVSASPGAAEAAGEVLAPAFTALGDYAHVLGQAALGEPAAPRPSPGPEVLAQAVAQALPQTRARLAPPVREAGIAGVAALARIAQAAEGRRLAPGALAREAEPHLAAVAALLRAVLGETPDQATRGAIRARREAMEAGHQRLLEAARRHGGLGPAGRYALFHQVAALRDEDPLPGTLGAIVALIAAMEEAHAALAAGDPAVGTKLAAFEAALARLAALTGQDQAEQ